MEINKIQTLLIIEPWDAYGRHSVLLLKNREDKFLFKIEDQFIFKLTNIKFLIGILRNDNMEDFCKLKKGKYIFNLFHDKSINAETLNNLDSLKIRSSFFIGEMEIAEENGDIG